MAVALCSPLLVGEWECTNPDTYVSWTDWKFLDCTFGRVSVIEFDYECGMLKVGLRRGTPGLYGPYQDVGDLE